jgi:transmembrane sensor
MWGNPAYDARLTEAADWIVRLQAADETQALAFDAWLSADPANAWAYDAALAVWTEFGANAQPVGAALSERRVRPTLSRRTWLAGGALAAAIAAAMVIVPQLQTDVPADSFQTARGERRAVNLADGSTLELNAGTRLDVTLASNERHVVLHEGQAIFDVAKDADRPFTIAAGDRTVRVVGTRFDVRRRDGKLSVTVAEGIVEVRPAAGATGTAFRLHPGQRLDHQEGAALARVTAASPDEVLAWRTGRLVYRGQPLSEVVADLNAHFATPIHVDDPQLAATPISGVLILDDEAAVIRRLALLVSAEPVRSGTGVVLRR